MRVILVRHGKTEWNETGRCQGVSDVPLSSAGLEQAERVALSLKDEEVGRIYSSDLSRARTTAEKIASYHPAEVSVRSDLREMHQGIFEGLYFSQIRERYPEVLEHWRRDPETLELPGGEALAGVQQRAVGAVSDIADGADRGSAVVVTHNMFIGTLLCRCAGSPLKNFRDYLVDEASKSVIEASSGGFVILSLNDTGHLGYSESGPEGKDR